MKRTSTAIIHFGLALAIGIYGPTLTPASANSSNLPTKLSPSDAAIEKRFGASVGISGTTIIVGAPKDRVDGSDAGAAYFFEQQPSGAWQQTIKHASTTPVTADRLGYSVDLTGNTAIVGSQNRYAKVYERNLGGFNTWGESATLTPPGLTGNNWFGWAVGISDDTAIVGSGDSSTAYVFGRNTGGQNHWGQMAILTGVGSSVGDRFGFTAAVSNNTAIVGAMYDQAPGPESGAAYIFDRNLGGIDKWGEAIRLQPSDVEAYDRFGQGVAIAGDTAVVGAWWDNGNGAKSGSAYVFDRNAGGPNHWGQVAKLLAQDVTSEFGFSVDISGDTVVIGAPYDDDRGAQAGAAYFFGRNYGGTNSWGQFAKVLPTDFYATEFGGAVAISGDIAVIGVVYDREHGNQSGAAYVLAVPECSSLISAAIGIIGFVVPWGERRRRSIETTSDVLDAI